MRRSYKLDDFYIALNMSECIVLPQTYRHCFPWVARLGFRYGLLRRIYKATYRLIKRVKRMRPAITYTL